MRCKRRRDKKKLVRLAALFLLVASPALGGQVSVSTSVVTEIGSHDGARIALSFYTADATNPIYCDYSSTVSSSTGMKLGPTTGPVSAFTIDSCQGTHCGANQAYYCIATGSAVTVFYTETR